MKLEDAQALFWEGVRSRRAPAALASVFVSRGALDAKARMQIYRRAYWSRHEQGLRECYPRLYEHLGPEAFRELVAGYIAQNPSTEPAIERAGARLPEYLGEHRALGEARSALRELAQLEWARVAALLAGDPCGALDPRELGTSDAPGRALRMHPSLSVAGGRAVFRGPSGVVERALEAEEARALERALARGSLTEICAQFAEPNAEEHAQRAIAGWIARGWIIGLEAP